MQYTLNDIEDLSKRRIKKAEVVKVDIERGFISFYTEQGCVGTYALSEFSAENSNKITITN